MAYEIEGIMGTPGAGKTYFGVYRLWRAHQANPRVPIWTNMDHLVLRGGQRPRLVSTLEDIYDCHDGYLFIDEAHLWVNSRDWARRTKDWSVFISQCRKRRLNLWYTTQAISGVDKELRDKTECTYVMKSLHKLGFFLAHQFPYCQIKGKQMGPPTVVPFNRIIAASYDTEGMIYD